MARNFKSQSFTASVAQYLAQDALLPGAQLKRLAEHKYSSSDNSILDALFMQKFWNQIVKFYPLWVAPNLITITGLILNMASVCLLAFYSPDGTGSDAPRWAYFLCAATLFIYQTLDATDGKQARRTNTCSPLGELFDHGCDSLSQVFVALEICLSLMLGHHPKWFLFICICAQVVFYCAHWQTYVSGTLTFGRFDVTEGQFVVIIICILTAVFGPSFWLIEVLPGVQLRFVFVAFGASMTSFTIVRYFQLIFTGGVGKNGSTVADTSILYPILPLFAMVLPQVLIYSQSKTDDIARHLVLFCILFGIVAAKITTKLVVAHMTKSQLTMWDTIFYGPAVLIFNQYMGTIVSEYHVLWICLVYCAINFVCYSKQLCDVICAYLNIKCFRIPYAVPSVTSKSGSYNNGATGQVKCS